MVATLPQALKPRHSYSGSFLSPSESLLQSRPLRSRYSRFLLSATTHFSQKYFTLTFTAILLNGIKRFSVTFRVINYLPVVTSWVIASLVFRYIFNTEGLLNYFLWKVVGITSSNIRWLDTRWGGISVAMILGIWKGIGWNMVIFLAALQQVPQDLYEASEIDGCGAWGKFVHVTLPGIKGTILFALIELTIGGFNVFTSIKMITGGKPAHQTDTLLTWMYYKAFSTGKFGYAAALSFVMALCLGLLAIVQFRMMRNRDN